MRTTSEAEYFDRRAAAEAATAEAATGDAARGAHRELARLYAERAALLRPGHAGPVPSNAA